MAIIRDVTDYRRFEQKLEEARQNAEAASRAKSEFLASMSHELRSPLHTIIGFSELLAEGVDGPLKDKQRRFVHHIQKDSQHLLTLINDILDLSKIEAGPPWNSRWKWWISPHWCKRPWPASVPRPTPRGLTLSAQCPEQLQAWGDRVRIRQVLDNLLSNAMKFTPAGGSVTVESHALGAKSVWPSPTPALAFRRVAGSHLRRLLSGLSHYQRRARRHRARPRHQSQAGRKARRQHLGGKPGKAREAASSSPSVLPCSTIGPRTVASPSFFCWKTIWVPANCCAAIWEADNYELVCVHAIRDTLVKALEIRPDLIVLDVLLPGASGYDALRSLKRLHETRDIPVVVLSVVADESALKFGATAYLTKPVNKTQFLKTVKRLAPRANPATPGLAPATTGTADSASARAGQPSGIGGSGHLPDY